MPNSGNIEAPEVQEIDLSEVPGFHVVQGKIHLGTYPSRDEAQAYIDGQLVPQGIKNAKIIEGAE